MTVTSLSTTSRLTRMGTSSASRPSDQRADVGGGQGAQRGEGGVVPPLVVDDVGAVDADQRPHRLVGHRARGCRGPRPPGTTGPGPRPPAAIGAEQQRQRALPGGVGDDQAERAAVEVQPGDLLLDERGHGLVVEDHVGPPDARRHAASRRTSAPRRSNASSVPMTSAAKVRGHRAAPVGEGLRSGRRRPLAACRRRGRRVGEDNALQPRRRYGRQPEGDDDREPVGRQAAVGPRAATTGSRRCGSFREPSAPTWRQVWPSAGLREAAEGVLGERRGSVPGDVRHLEDVVDRRRDERRPRRGGRRPRRSSRSRPAARRRRAPSGGR